MMKNTRTKIWNKIAAIVSMILVVILVMPSYGASANEYDGVGYEPTKKLLKKVQKNAIKYYPDPNSKELTWGYAASSIKAFLESDENAYIDETSDFLRVIKASTGKNAKFTGGTKSQRKALKWCVKKGIVSYSPKKYGEDPSSLKTTYNASQKITRWQLVDLVSRTMGFGYGGRIPYLNGWSTGTADYPEENEAWVLDYCDKQCVFKGVMYIVPVTDYLHLNNQIATRDDLVRCLKNLKLIAASKYTAKVIYRDEPLNGYTEANYQKDIEAIKSILESNGLSYIDKGYNEFGIGITNSNKKIAYSTFSLEKNDGFHTSIGVNGGNGREQIYGITYNLYKVDIVKTFNEIIKKRG